METKSIPEVVLNSGHKMPMLGFGTGTVPLPPHHELIPAFINAIKVGYRHFDTAAYYGSEESLGQAIAQALEQVRLRQGVKAINYTNEDILPFDMKGTWKDMEQCANLGLAKSIGLSNFGVKKISEILEYATIPPALVQVEMNAAWHQEYLRKFCKEKGIHVSAWSPLGANGAPWGSLAVMDNPIIKDIAISSGKAIAQVALRWLIEQGATPIVKSFNKERMKKNIELFDWELSEVDLEKIKQVSQCRGFKGERFITENGPYKTTEDLFD
ncbi:protein REDOX 2 [Medicago truncatula]|uniref:protein REDOX 2 n=1 Tax=Medicago truncatula TaxID=3880 RepID=UPI001967755A|nr:protein REDOX 2 [Medicago truncatula]